VVPTRGLAGVVPRTDRLTAGFHRERQPRLLLTRMIAADLRVAPDLNA
jgi:hypothetical protein